MNYNNFISFGLNEDDSKIGIVNQKIYDNNYKKAIKIEIPLLEISVQCWSEKSLMKDKEKCFEMLYCIINNKKQR